MRGWRPDNRPSGTSWLPCCQPEERIATDVTTTRIDHIPLYRLALDTCTSTYTVEVCDNKWCPTYIHYTVHVERMYTFGLSLKFISMRMALAIHCVYKCFLEALKPKVYDGPIWWIWCLLLISRLEIVKFAQVCSCPCERKYPSFKLKARAGSIHVSARPGLSS